MDDARASLNPPRCSASISFAPAKPPYATRVSPARDDPYVFAY